jgi:hypothetical protein
MSHKTTVTGVNITSADAFVKAMLALGCTNAQLGGTIFIHDGRHIHNAVASATVSDGSRKYSVGLIKEGDKLVLTGDFQCFGWALPAVFVKAMALGDGQYINDKAIQDTILRNTTAHTMKEAAEAEGYSVDMVTNSDGTLELQMETY